MNYSFPSSKFFTKSKTSPLSNNKSCAETKMSHEKDSQYYSVDGDIFSVTTKSIELKATPLKGVAQKLNDSYFT